MPKIRGPVNGVLCAATFDGISKIDRTSKKAKNTKNEKNLVLVSVQGNDYCNQEYLRVALLSAGNEFSHTTFLIVDDPQCYNLAAAESSENHLVSNAQAKLDEARMLGDKWWRANESAILKCLPEAQRVLCSDKFCPDVNSKIKTFNDLAQKNNLKIDFIRWQDWIHQSALADTQVFEKYREEFNSAPDLKASRTKTAEKFSSRKTKNNNGVSTQPKDNNQIHDVFLNYSQQFLTDESIGVMIAGKEKGYHYVSYAGDQIAVLKSAYNHFVDPNSNLMGWLSINFEKRTLEESFSPSNSSNVLPYITPVDLDHLKDKNICIHIVPFKEKENQNSCLKKTAELFKAKCNNDTAIQTKNYILIEDSLARFEWAIKDKEYEFTPKFYTRIAKDIFNKWCLSHDEIINTQKSECKSYFYVKEEFSQTYNSVLANIESKINTNSAFKKAFENSALAYLDEIKNSKCEIIEESKAKAYALEAVKEKCAVLFTIAMTKRLKCLNQPIIEKEAFNVCKQIFSGNITFWNLDSTFNQIAENTASINEYQKDDICIADNYWDRTLPEEVSNALQNFTHDTSNTSLGESPQSLGASSSSNISNGSRDATSDTDTSLDEEGPFFSSSDRSPSPHGRDGFNYSPPDNCSNFTFGNDDNDGEHIEPDKSASTSIANHVKKMRRRSGSNRVDSQVTPFSLFPQNNNTNPQSSTPRPSRNYVGENPYTFRTTQKSPVTSTTHFQNDTPQTTVKSEQKPP